MRKQPTTKRGWKQCVCGIGGYRSPQTRCAECLRIQMLPIVKLKCVDDGFGFDQTPREIFCERKSNDGFDGYLVNMPFAESPMVFPAWAWKAV